MMKAEILFHISLAQGDIKYVDAETQTYSEVLDDINTLLKISL